MPTQKKQTETTSKKEQDKDIDLSPKADKSWADQEEEEDDDKGGKAKVEEKDRFVPTNTYDPKTNIRTAVEYKKNEKGQLVKITRVYEVKSRRVSLFTKQVAKRKEWKKFGQCAGLPPGPEKGITEVSPDEIKLILGDSKNKQEEVKEDKLVNQNIECRICKKVGDHYTPRCPLKNSIAHTQDDDNDNGNRDSSAAKPGSYVPPNKRGVTSEGDSRGDQRSEFPTVRVSNLSESATESDLQELFKPFGAVQRVFIAKDKTTGDSRGFGFVTFYNRPDAVRAIAKLDGHGYDHLILHLEWALPSKKM